MKKFVFTVLSAALLLMGTQAFAQMSTNVGYLNATTKCGDNSANSNGFYVGFSYNVPIVAGLGIAPGFYASMLFSSKSDSASASIFGFNLGANTKVFNYELAANAPVMLNYGFDLARDFRVFLFAGPTFQFGILNKSKASYSASAGSSSTGDTSTTDLYGDNGYNRFNVLMGGGIGMVAGSYQVLVGYDATLMDMDKSDNTKTSRSFIKIGVGLAF